MKAYRLLEWGRSGYDEVEVPTPGPGEVLLKVAGAGLCHSDLDFIDVPPGERPRTWPDEGPGAKRTSPPWTIGHENAGHVAALGPGLSGRFAEGDPVIATGATSCGRCEFCVRGHDTYCENVIVGRGVGIDGGLAEHMIHYERHLVPLSTSDPARFAPLADAGHTSYTAVQHLLPKLRPGTAVLVIGVGGLGFYAVQYLRLLSEAKVIAVDRSPERLEIAREIGAHETLLAEDASIEAVRELSGGRGVEGVLDFVVDEQTMQLGMRSAAKLSSVILVGLGGGRVDFEWGTLPPLGCQVFSIVGGSFSHLFEVMALAESGQLRIDVDWFAWDEIESAYEKLRKGGLRGRAVVRPNG